jgi:DNA-binding transcriptional LysR family regulator
MDAVVLATSEGLLAMSRILSDKFSSERFLHAITLRQIRYFIAAAEFGKVSTAASMISISPSAITGAINELEALLELTLFDRHPQGISLTHEGQRFLARCRGVLSALREASYTSYGPDSELRGSFRMAVSSTVIGYFIAPLLARFASAYPDVETHLVEGLEPRITEGLLKNEYDLAYVIISNFKPHPKIQRQILVRSPRRLWLGPKHPLLEQSKITMTDIARLPYIQLTIDGAEQSTARYWDDHSLKPQVIFRSESVEAVRSLIAFGHGVTILSDMMYRPWSLEGDSVEAREIAEQLPTLDTGFLWTGDEAANPAALAFQRFCQIEVQPRASLKQPG